MEVIVVLFFFGLSAGVVGRIKGSSFFIWFLVGACLPALGTLAALFMRFERDEDRRRCPECNKVQPIYVQVCTRCGRDLEYPLQASGSQA